MKKADEAANENMDIRGVYINDFQLEFSAGPKISKISIVDGAGIFKVPNDGSVGNGRFENGSVKIGNIATVNKSISATESNDIFFGLPTSGPKFQGLSCTIEKNGTTINATVNSIVKRNAALFVVTLTGPVLDMAALNGAAVFFGGSLLPSCNLTAIQNSNVSFTVCSIKIPVILKDDDYIAALPYADGPLQINKDFVNSTYKSAYIDAIFDGGGNLANNKDNVGFKINLENPSDLQDLYSSLADSKSLETDNYWIGNIVLGWQGQKLHDADPKGEADPSIVIPPSQAYVDYGLTPIGSVEQHCSVANGFDISFICIENIRDILFNDPANNYEVTIGHIIAHELGHQFGLTHGFDFGGDPETDCADCAMNPCKKIGLMSSDYDASEVVNGFKEFQLNLLRARVMAPRQ